jgi:hypothetical protein
MMKPPQIDYCVLNDDARWADSIDCLELLFAGVWFLHETMQTRWSNCPLLKRIIRLGDRYEALMKVGAIDRSQVTSEDMGLLFSEMNTLGTFGHSLWHLKCHLDTPAVRYELKELSRIGCGENEEGDLLRIRGQGFLFLAAANLSKQGFELDFIPRRKDESTPDFYARRDGNTFTCEVTNRYPQSGALESLEFFWSTLNETVSKKKAQLAKAAFPHGVLIIDCTPVWDAFGLGHFIEGGVLVYSIPPEQGGPRSGSVPLIRHADPEHSEGLRNLAEVIRGTAIHTLILWKHKLEIHKEGYRREMMYRVVGTITGATFWSYFPKAFVFPGAHMDVKWE